MSKRMCYVTVIDKAAVGSVMDLNLRHQNVISRVYMHIMHVM